jgi:hypothetical protein
VGGGREGGVSGVRASALTTTCPASIFLCSSLTTCSYADSEEERWDSWQELIQYVSSRVPWMTQVGK